MIASPLPVKNRIGSVEVKVKIGSVGTDPVSEDIVCPVVDFGDLHHSGGLFDKSLLL